MFTDTTYDSLLRNDHAYRKIIKLLNLKPLVSEFEELYSKVGAPAVPVEKGLKALILQFMEDYSDRQMDAALRENIAVKWFCGFALQDITPGYTYFCKFRKRLGTENVAMIFNAVVDQMRAKGIVGEVFTFIDATAVITKTALWDERDKAIKDGFKKLDNKLVKNYSADKQARFGCKGKRKFWFGYKRHVGVDMKSGVITKVAMTPANLPDGQALKHVCPDSGMVFADKAYCGKETQREIKARGCHSGVILKENMKGKDRRHDSWLTKVRMPYEGVFSKTPRRARYRGQAKLQMQGFMEAVGYNLKRWVRIEDELTTLAMAET